MTAPRVSVCIPSYNHAPYLAEAIDSVLAQTYRDFEIVIVDDGSTDHSLEIAQGYAARFPDVVRVLTHANHANLGISETVNRAYQESRGEFWSGLPSDDMLYPDKLERQVAFLDAHPNIGWLYSRAKRVNEVGEPHAFGLMGQDITSSGNPLQQLIRGNVVLGMTVLMRRSCTEQVGLHEPGLIYSDWEFWLRMANHCPVAYMPQPCVKYRVHTYNSSIDVEGGENARRALEVLRSFRERTRGTTSKFLDARTRALLELQLAYHFYCVNDEAQARQSLIEAFAIDSELKNDSTFFASWLRGTIFHLQHSFPMGSRESQFALWLPPNLPFLEVKSLARKAQAAHFAKLAFENYETDRRSCTRLALNCLRQDFSWILDRSLRTVAVKGLFGNILSRKPSKTTDGGKSCE